MRHAFSHRPFCILQPQAYGAVLLLLNERGQPECVAKVVRDCTKLPAKIAEHLRNERRCLETVTSLQLPHVVQFLGSGRQGSELHLFTQYVPGFELHKLVAHTGRCTPLVTRHLCRQLCKAVGAMHHNGIFHRDLKLSNVKCNSDGQLTVLDFSLSTQVTDQRERKSSFCGTLCTMAPEVLRCDTYRHNNTSNFLRQRRDWQEAEVQRQKKHEGENEKKNEEQKSEQTEEQRLIEDRQEEQRREERRLEVLFSPTYDVRADWWAVGAIAYELAVGISPFGQPTSDAETRELMLHTAASPYSLSFPPDLPAMEQDFISHLLTANPDQRLGNGGGDEVLAHPWLRLGEDVPLGIHGAVFQETARARRAELLEDYFL